MEKLTKFSDFAKSKVKEIAKTRLVEAQTEYSEKFRKRLEEFGVNSPSELSDDKKKEFFDGLKEALETIKEAELSVKDEGTTTLNQVAVDPTTVTPQKDSKEEEALNKTVEVPSTDGTSTATKIENTENTASVPKTITDDKSKQGEDVAGAATSEAEITEEIDSFITKFFEFLSDEEFEEFTNLEEEETIIAKMNELKEKYNDLVEAKAKEYANETFTITTRRLPTFQEFMLERENFEIENEE